MILSCREMKALEERAFAEGITAEELMDEAGRKIATGPSKRQSPFSNTNW